MLLDLLFRIVLRLFLIILYGEYMDKGKLIYKCGEGGMKMLGGTEILGVWVRGL